MFDANKIKRRILFFIIGCLINLDVKTNNGKMQGIFNKISLIFFRRTISANGLHASDGRDTEALNCKPITNL
jgi:hypothetical protein